MNGKKPNKAEKAWLTAISDYGCCICKQEGIFSPCEYHHTNGGSDHLSAIGLCMPHHRGGEDNALYTARHPFKAAFERRYGKETGLLAELREKLEY